MSIKPYEVKTVNIATKAVTSEKIADKAIQTRHIEEGAVTPDKLTFTPVARPLTPGLDSTEIKDAAVTNAKIAGNAVTNDKIASGSVNADKIADGAVTTEKIRDGAITRDKVADRSVNTADLVDGAVTGVKIASNTITGAKIAANAVGSSEIAADAVRTSELANGAVTAEKLAPGVGGGDRFLWGAEGGEGNPRSSLEIVYEYNRDLAFDIPWTDVNCNLWVPVGAKALIVNVGILTQSYTSGAQPSLRIRTNESQREAIQAWPSLQTNRTMAIGGVIPLVGSGDRVFQYSVSGLAQMTVTFWVTLVGYIM